MSIVASRGLPGRTPGVKNEAIGWVGDALYLLRLVGDARHKFQEALVNGAYLLNANLRIIDPPGRAVNLSERQKANGLQHIRVLAAEPAGVFLS